MKSKLIKKELDHMAKVRLALFAKLITPREFNNFLDELYHPMMELLFRRQGDEHSKKTRRENKL